MSRDWQSVQEMSIWLRKTETAEKLYGQPTPQPYIRKFFPKRPTLAMSTEETESHEEVGENDEPNEMVEVEESPCNVSNSRRNVGNKKSWQSNAATEARQKKSVCFNCKSNQHYFNDCDQPVSRVFCFRCGKEEILAPNCECRELREQSKNGVTVAAVSTELCD